MAAKKASKKASKKAAKKVAVRARSTEPRARVRVQERSKDPTMADAQRAALERIGGSSLGDLSGVTMRSEGGRWVCLYSTAAGNTGRIDMGPADEE